MLITKSLNKVFQSFQSGAYLEAMSSLSQLTQSFVLGDATVKEAAIAEARAHPVFQLLQQDPYTRRSFQKPWGYSGDAGLIDYIYTMAAPEPTDTLAGREIFHACMGTTSCRAVRYRAALTAELMEDFAAKLGRPLEAFVVAGGFLREWHALKNPAASIAYLKAMDAEESCITRIHQELIPNNPQIEAYRQDLLKLVLGNEELGKYDWVHALGIFDYLNEKVAVRLINRMLNLCKTGGRVFVANFCPGNTEQGYMEFFMDWQLIYRDESQLQALLNKVDVPFRTVQTFRDPWGRILYAELERV